MKQVRAHASTNVNHRSELRSQRICSRLKQLRHDSTRSTASDAAPHRVDSISHRRFLLAITLDHSRRALRSTRHSSKSLISLREARSGLKIGLVAR